MFKKGDYVYVIFSDGHREKGQIIDILNTDSYNYIVNVKVYGKDTEVYCNEKDLLKYD